MPIARGCRDGTWLAGYVSTAFVDAAEEASVAMSELPVVVLVQDEHGDVERAAERLRGAGMRNPMVHLRNLCELAEWRTGRPWEIAFLIVHADACHELDTGEMPPLLPAYPAFAVHSTDGRLMASTWLSPGTRGTTPRPFDASTVMRSLQALGLRWLVV
jgi:hypothetical protein